MVIMIMRADARVGGTMVLEEIGMDAETRGEACHDQLRHQAHTRWCIEVE